MAQTNITTHNRIPRQFQRAAQSIINWIPIAIVIGFWELASGTVVANDVLPSPIIVAFEVNDLIISGDIYSHLFISIYRFAIGIGLSISIGVLLGISMARSKPIENFFDVFLSILYPIPKVALVPLAMLWLGVGTGPAILVVFLACLLPIILNSYNAAENVDQNLIWSAKMMGTDGWELLQKVVIPATIPNILTGIRQAIPIAFIALVSAELIASYEGIGYLILEAGQVGNYQVMFANIVIISVVAYLFVTGFEMLREKVIVWV
ncbi:ABC transporter permease [Natrarchaeobius halalkaliphilus]|uniref:ABC transporter permease n=1 Tax=Natrarchaeobius halalkaliphilus TaxID=1679091 RepID=A0A3N6MSW4_9EURY|nr:ABC transporter permease [Natrarchaeobius halalkaliphilus]RQG87855.1 ABC transporter permease [Natrarchaeobius halalkaliphilus]